MKISRVLYLGWLRHGNVGDDLLFTVFSELITKEALAKNMGVIIDVAHEEYEFSILHYNLIVLGGGSLLVIPGYLDICLKAKSLGIPVVIWGSGIDLRYGAHVDYLLYGFFNGKKFASPDRIVPNYSNMQAVVEYAKAAAVRGNLTHYLVNSRKVSVIGDPAIIFDKLGYSYPDIAPIDTFTEDSETVVLINWGTAYGNIIGGNESMLLENLRLVIKTLLARKIKIILYPIWVQDIPSCKHLSNSFSDKTLFLVDRVYDVYGLSHIIQKCKYTINLKLHANILSMALQKPFLSLAYGLKCYDFAHSVNALDLVVPTNHMLAKEVLEKIDYIESNYKNIQNNFSDEINACYRRQSTYMQEIVAILNN